MKNVTFYADFLTDAELMLVEHCIHHGSESLDPSNSCDSSDSDSKDSDVTIS